jgi:hypothetical protein
MKRDVKGNYNSQNDNNNDNDEINFKNLVQDGETNNGDDHFDSQEN